MRKNLLINGEAVAASQDGALVSNTRSTKIHIGLAMKECGYELTKRGNRPYYKVVPIAKTAA